MTKSNLSYNTYYVPILPNINSIEENVYNLYIDGIDE